ncbi:MAG: hypothetical protein NZ805_13095, partial [Armatimonadetes bacterium]|nr:hypothetical protein [Armatimonadota bacterium]
RQIEDDWDHDVAIGRIALYFQRKGNPERAKQVAKEKRDEKGRQVCEFIIDWSEMLCEASEKLSPEELAQLLIDEWGD